MMHGLFSRGGAALATGRTTLSVPVCPPGVAVTPPAGILCTAGVVGVVGAVAPKAGNPGGLIGKPPGRASAPPESIVVAGAGSAASSSVVAGVGAAA